MAAEDLSLDEQFFYRIALKNGLISAEEGNECLRVRRALASRGKRKTIQAIMLDTGLLTPEEVDAIHEAQAASQVLRLDSLYADLALGLGFATREQLDSAFKLQRERRFKVRIGELLMDRGVMDPARHRQVLARLLASIRSEEKEYIRELRLKKRLVPAARAPVSEAERLALAVTEAGGRQAPVPALTSAPPPAPASSPAAASSAREPLAATSRESSAGLRVDSEDLEEVEAPKLPEPPATRAGEPAPEPPPIELRESVQAWLGRSSSDRLPQAAKPGAEPPRAPGSSSSDELGQSFFAANVLAVREEARAAGPPSQPRGKAASASGRREPPRSERGRRRGREREPRKADPAKLLESAIEMIEDSPAEMSAVRGDAPAGPAPGLARGLQQSDIRAVEGDIRSAEDAGTSGLARIRSLRPSSDRDGSPAFSADEYVKRRRRRALLARCAAAAVFFLIVCPFGAGIWVANRNKTALDEARAAMGRGEFDEARARLAGAGEFWVGREAIAALGDEIGFREALVPADEAERAGDLARAAAAVAAARERFPRFAEEAQKRERRLLCAVQLAAGERAERAGDLAGAVAAYDRARQHAQPDDRRAADRIEAIRKALEADIEAAKEARDLERQLVAMRRLRAVFGGGAADIERLELEIGLRDEMAKGDKAAEGRDYEGALDHYYRASEAATKLGRAREIADLEARTRRARKRANFQRFFNEGEALELKGRYAEAIQAYSRARSWITPPVASAPPPLGPPVLSGMTGAAAPPAAEESDGGLASLLDARVRACEEARARDEGEAQASRLWREAIDALRASRVDQAVAALEALSRARPREDKVRNALAFARSLGDAVYVPAGEAVIGSSAQGAEKDEFPEHKVSIPAFFADRYEVRNREYAAFVEATGAAPPEHWLESRGDGAARVRARTYAPEHADHPVVNVSFFEAERYAAWAKKRLPTEEEWEKAARGTQGRLFPWGASPEGAKANVGAKISDRIAIGTKPVGTSPGDVSPFGCSDMGGNVSEWTASPYRPYRGNQAKGIEWSDEQRVIRGGSWRYEWSYARCSNRDRSRPEKRYPEVGFRCVVDVPDWLPELK